MIQKTIVLALLFLITTLGCTSKEIYDATQPKYNEAECMRLPRSQYEECMNRDAETYEEYEKERNEKMNPALNTL